MMKTKRIILSVAVVALAFGVGFAGVTVTAAAAEALSGLLAKGEVAETKEPVIEEVEPESPVAIVTEPVSNEVESVDQTGSENETVEFYADGTYYIDETGLPEAFRDVATLDIVSHDFEKTNDDGTYGVPIPPKGELRTKKQFKFARIAINGKKISFQTETVNGVSYRFTGSYNSGDYCETDGSTPDLTGQLIKLRDGKWAAAMKAEFYAEGCGC